MRNNQKESHYGERIQRITDFVLDGQWHTLHEIAEGIGRPGSECSVAAALQTLRRQGYYVECDRKHYPEVSRFRVF